MKTKLLLLLILLEINNLSAQEYLSTNKQIQLWKPTTKVVSLKDYYYAEEKADKVIWEVKYKGDVINGFASGNGKATYYAEGKKCLVYEGSFKNGLPNGMGKLEAFGQAKLILLNYVSSVDINYYNGQFINGMFEGEGHIYYYDKSSGLTSTYTYTGTFKNGKQSGTGEYSEIIELKDKNIKYSGLWLDGKKNGNGRYYGELYLSDENKSNVKILNAYDTYEGEWRDDMPNGKGKFTFSNGQSYDGDVMNGIMMGCGKITYSNGDYFVGKVENGEIADSGAYYFSNGNLKFDGNWISGEPSGMGKYADGNTTKNGYFVAGKCIGDEEPWLSRKNSVQPLNKSLYNNYKFYDLFNVNERYEKFLPVNNGTAIVFDNGKLLDLNNLQLYNFGNLYDYSNLNSTIGIRRDNSTFYIYDYLNKKTNKIEIKGITPAGYWVTPDGSMIVINKEKGGTLIVSAIDGKIINDIQIPGNCFFSIDNKYAVIVNMEYERHGSMISSYTVTKISITLISVMNSKILDTKKSSFDRRLKSLNFNFFDNNSINLRFDVEGSDSDYNENYKITNNKLEPIKSSPVESNNFVHYVNNTYYHKNLAHLINIIPCDNDQLKFNEEGKQKMPINGISVHYEKVEYKYYYYIKQLNNKINLNTTSASKRVYNFGDYFLDSLCTYTDDQINLGRKIITKDSLLIIPYYKNFSRYRDINFLRIYNISNLMKNVGFEKIIDYDKNMTQQRINDIYEKQKSNIELKKFRQAISHDEFIYVAPSNSRNLVDWVNSKSADEIRQGDKINVFVGGTVHNCSDTTYKVEVHVTIYTRKTTTALFILSETQQVQTFLKNYLTVKPGQTVPFLVCLKDLSSGYFNTGSGWGSRVVLDDPAYRVSIRKYDGEIEQETINNQKKLLNDILTYGNLKEEKSIFRLDENLTELNVYYLTKKEYEDLQFELKENNSYTSPKISKSIKTYKGNKCHFIVDPSKQYKVTILGNTYTPILKKGIVQMFIKENGEVTFEYNDK